MVAQSQPCLTGSNFLWVLQPNERSNDECYNEVAVYVRFK